GWGTEPGHGVHLHPVFIAHQADLADRSPVIVGGLHVEGDEIKPVDSGRVRGLLFTVGRRGGGPAAENGGDIGGARLRLLRLVGGEGDHRGGLTGEFHRTAGQGTGGGDLHPGDGGEVNDPRVLP